jgi:hypothetical protein
MKHTLLSAALLAILVSGSAFAQPKPAAVDPCSLLTAADIKELAGLDTSGGTLNKNNAAVCDYKVGAGGVVSVSVPPGSPATPDVMMAELNKRNIKTETAAGVGDRAFFAAMGYGMIQLNAFKGRTYVIITLMLPGMDEAKTKGVATKLMNKALAKF